MTAPACPVSRNQPAPGTPPGRWPASLPQIPVATDLPSLIRTVNLIRQVLSTLTTSLTVNNIWVAPTGANVYVMSGYPDWAQTDTQTSEGYVYHKAKSGPDPNERAYVRRTNAVAFQNYEAAGDIFTWRATKPLDSMYGDAGMSPPFQEDFFERIINVHWGGGLAVEFGDKAGGPPGSSSETPNVPDDGIDTEPPDTGDPDIEPPDPGGGDGTPA